VLEHTKIYGRARSCPPLRETTYFSSDAGVEILLDGLCVKIYQDSLHGGHSSTSPHDDCCQGVGPGDCEIIDLDCMPQHWSLLPCLTRVILRHCRTSRYKISTRFLDSDIWEL